MDPRAAGCRILPSNIARHVLLAGLLALCSLAHDAKATEPIYTFDFSQSDEAFAVEDPCLTWVWGEPDAGLPGSGAGAVWATGLNTTYPFECSSSLTSPFFDLAEYPEATLLIYHYHDTHTGNPDQCMEELNAFPSSDDACGDGGQLRLLGDGEKTLLEPYGGYETVIAIDGEASQAFGSEEAFTTDYFDLMGQTADTVQLELFFSSNNTQSGYGWYVSLIQVYPDDIVPPILRVDNPPDDTADVVGPYEISVYAEDNRLLESVELTYSVDDEENTVVPLTAGEGENEWLASIPGVGGDADLEMGVEITYSIRATDDSGNSSRWPSEGEASFRVQLPAPSDLIFEWDYEGEEQPRTLQTLVLYWTAPDPESYPEKYSIVGYEIQHSIQNSEGIFTLMNSPTEDLDGDTGDETARVAIQGYPNTDYYGVCAKYLVPVNGDDDTNLICGALSKTIHTQIAVPRLTSIAPSVGYQGFPIDVTIIGSLTTFKEGDVSLEVGEGIDVSSLEVIDVSTIEATLELASDLPVGTYTPTVTWADGTASLENEFTVLGHEDRPQLLSLSPDTAEQGEQKVIKFLGANTVFTVNRPTVDFQSGIKVGEVTVISDTEFEVPIEVASFALNGERDVTVVSGSRSWQAEFYVKVVATETPSCSLCTTDPSRPGRVSLLPILLGGLYLLRRRRGCGGSWHRGGYEYQQKESRPDDRPDDRHGYRHVLDSGGKRRH